VKRNKKHIIIWLFPVLFLVGIIVVFYWKFFLKGLIPFPGDLMIGAYFPWLEYKWGNAVGVVIKNTLISDIFSQFYLWKNESASSLANGIWPLWNPYSYSGLPLLATFNYGILNPLNMLIALLGKNTGWSYIVIFQTFGSAISMYFFLKSLKKQTASSLIGAVVYSFGGFAMVRSQFVNVGYAYVYLPAALMLIEYTSRDKNGNRLAFLSPLIFLIATAGHFQSMVYSGVLIASYYVYRIGIKSKKCNLIFLISVLLSIGMSLIQLLPTIELMNHSVRFEEGYIKSVNYGLLPGRNLITLIAPDFFGNPSTGNYWGFLNYHETIAYAGVIGIFALMFGILNFRKLKVEKFFIITAIIALCLQFDTPLGKSIYLLKIPFMWTSSAGRVNFVFLLSIPVIVSGMVDRLHLLSIYEKIRIAFLPIALIVTSGIVSFFCLFLFKQSGLNSILELEIANLNIGIRNLVIPLAITGMTTIIILLSNKAVFWKYAILIVVLADLFRFGWKYNPFVSESYIFPSTEVIDFIKKDESIFRVDREASELLPPNTWAGYGLMSPSGYDPMAVMSYVKQYSFDLNGYDNGGISRYSELNRINAEALGKYNVKYLLAIKRDKESRIPGDLVSYKINEDEWSRVFETKSVAVMQNLKYEERARIVDTDGNNANGTAEIVSYENNKVVIKFSNFDGEKLLLADTYYPGWIATINGNKTKIGDEIMPFRTVDIRGLKEGEVVFEYRPKSFYVGLLISAISFGGWLGLVIFQVIDLRRKQR